ncbi:MAG: glycoside hydrolase family protein [Terrimicrobiaceae bacterium]
MKFKSESASNEHPSLNLSEWLRPVPASAKFSHPDYYIWCGTLTQAPDGGYVLLYSRWPKPLGFNSWATHSEICAAVSSSPFGPFEHHSVILPLRGDGYWDGLCTHNPTVHRFGDRYYLYYTGNTGDGKVVFDDLNWTHRNNQRIGVAWAEHPLGPWQRNDQPLIAPTPQFYDALCCNNPSVVQRPEGGFLMIYKCVGRERPLPFGGPVLHVAARSESPLGPFVKSDRPVFVRENVDFAAEDPVAFYWGGRYWAIVKDMGGYFTGRGKSLALFQSSDGFDWKTAPDCFVSDTSVLWEDGTRRALLSLERPQILMDPRGVPSVLLCAAHEADGGNTFNVQIPLKQPGSE